jgi:foldase protein PrsA
MTSPRRFSALLGAFFVLPLVLAACGGDSVPGNAVVKIGSDSIKTSEFDHWLQAAATTAQQQTGVTGKAAIPQPPEFTACIANKKKTAVKPAKGQPTPTDATYKSQCEQEYTLLRDQVMQFLISAAWIEGESADRGVKVSDAQVKKDFDKQRVVSFPKDKDYLAFLKSSGNVQEDLLYRIKIQDLSEKLRTKVLEGTDKITDAQIANYYNKNKIRFAVPEQRDLKIILTKTEAQSKKAKAALDSGQSFGTVARKYSIDQATKGDGGVLTGVPKGQQEKSLDAATFKAPLNKVGGPVKTQFGYYIFEVTKITPGKQQPLSTSKASIKQLLVSQKQQTTLDTFVKDFQKKWKDQTTCQKGYQTNDCSNPPKAKPSTPAPATTATPQQNPPPAGGSGTTTAPKK